MRVHTYGWSQLHSAYDNAASPPESLDRLSDGIGLRGRGQVEPRIGDLPTVLQTLRETFEAPLEDDVAARLQALIRGTDVDVARYTHAHEAENGCMIS